MKYRLLSIFIISLFTLIPASAQNAPPIALTAIRAVAWHPGGNWIARAFQNGTVDVIDVSDGSTIFSFTDGTSEPARALAWQPDSETAFLAAAVGEMVYMWDMPNDSPMTTIAWGLPARSLDWTVQGGDKLAGASFTEFGPFPNRTSSDLSVWDPFSGNLIFDQGVGQLARASWGPDGDRLIVGSGLAIRTVDIITYEVELLSPNSLELSAVQSVAWSPDGTRIASSGIFGQVSFWDGVTGQFISYTEETRLSVYWLAWSHDSSKLASASGDGTVRIWDGATGQKLNEIQLHAGRVFAVDWSPDGTQIVYGTEDGTMGIVEALPESPVFMPFSGDKQLLE